MNTGHPYWPELTDDEGDALAEWFDDTCGDCVEGRCHWGGEASRQSRREAAAGRDHVDPGSGVCGCGRHRTSVLARPFRDAHDETHATAVAWRDAKERGDVVVEHD